MIENKGFPRALSSLRHLGFRVLIIGQAISLLGTWVQGTAQRWLVLELTGSSFHVGILGAVSGLPILLFSIMGGLLADRFPKISFLLLIHSLIFVQAMIFGILVQAHQITFYWILFLALLLGTGMSFEVPARQSLVFDLVGKKDITNGIAIHSTAFNIARFCGPALAGILMNAGLMESCFYFKAASALAVMGSLFFIKKRCKVIDEPLGNKGKSILSSFGELFSFIKKRPLLLKILLAIMTFGIMLLPYSILLPSFGRDLLGLNAKEYGFMCAANGLGALFGAVFVAIFGHGGNRKSWWLLGCFLFPVSLCLFAISQNFLEACILLFVSGVIMVITSTSAISILQIEAKDELRGRIMGLFTTSFMGLFPLGSLIQGKMADVMGIRQTIIVFSAIAFFICLILFTRRKRGP